jgi:hypothetical protein
VGGLSGGGEGEGMMDFDKYIVPRIDWDNPDKDKIHELLVESRQIASEKTKQFHDDLLKEFKVENNPKAEKCYSLAWEHGHAYGYHEVYYYFSEFVTLIK